MLLFLFSLGLLCCCFSCFLRWLLILGWQIFLLKGQINISGFLCHCDLCCNYLLPLLSWQECSHGQYCKQRARLCSNEMSFTVIGGGLDLIMGLIFAQPWLTSCLFSLSYFLMFFKVKSTVFFFVRILASSHKIY